MYARDPVGKVGSLLVLTGSRGLAGLGKEVGFPGQKDLAGPDLRPISIGPRFIKKTHAQFVL